jgi:hypothetical protein
MKKCPHCQERAEHRSQHAIGGIWAHSHYDDGELCVFFTTSTDPHDNATRYGSLEVCWRETRSRYTTRDMWAKGWDAYFDGQQQQAEKLWKQEERSAAYTYA